MQSPSPLVLRTVIAGGRTVILPGDKVSRRQAWRLASNRRAGREELEDDGGWLDGGGMRLLKIEEFKLKV